MKVPSLYIDSIGFDCRLSHQKRGFGSVGHTYVRTRQIAGSSPMTRASASDVANARQADGSIRNPSGGGTSRAEREARRGRFGKPMSVKEGFMGYGLPRKRKMSRLPAGLHLEAGST
jgi:hypothetical protein